MELRTGPGKSEMLTEEQLKSMSRHVKGLLPRTRPTEHDLNQLITLFLDVFKTSEKSDLTAAHRVAAWNTLCAVIDQCATSKQGEIQNVIWKNDFWTRALKLYLEQSQHARPKSSKQLLQTLGGALKSFNTQPKATRSIAERLVAEVVKHDTSGTAKVSLQALAHFLRKDVLTLNETLSAFDAIQRPDPVGDSKVLLQEFLVTLFTWVAKGDFGSVVGQVLSAILDKHDDSKLEGPTTSARTKPTIIWAEPIARIVTQRRTAVDDLKARIFPVLFKRNLGDYISFLYGHGLEQLLSGTKSLAFEAIEDRTNNEELLFSALHTGKGLGLLHGSNAPEVSQSSSALHIPVRKIGRLLSRSSHNAQLTGLSLLIVSHSITRPLSRTAFKLLRRHLYHFFADTDANFRSEVFSLMQRLIDRIRAITAVLARHSGLRNSLAQSHSCDSPSVLDDHQGFLEWLLRFLQWSLRPTASYQTHISTLKTLSIVVKSGLDGAVPRTYLSKSALGEAKWPIHLSIMTNSMRQLLLNMLMDPFDDVRQTSASILSLYTTSSNVESQDVMRKAVSDALQKSEQTMLQTGRADHADGIAHLYALLYKVSDRAPATQSSNSPRTVLLIRLIESVESSISIAKRSLAAAVDKYPMHGLFTSLRYIIDQSGCDIETGVATRLCTCSHAVWEVVKPILCDDAPEGYLPEDLEEVFDISTKDILSYSWRSLKESSLLLAELVTNPSVGDDSVLSLSNLCFTQLAELRHRGAFSTVAQSWTVCCKRVTSVKIDEVPSPLRIWYDRVLDILQNDATINTRRSAGLPSLICGLLIAEPSGEMFSRAYRDLTAISRRPVDSGTTDKTSLPQVHALNCIKDILKNTRLGELSERYVPQALGLAAESLRSEAWAVRNCGLMLFRAVIDRLLGTSDAHADDHHSMSRRDIIIKYPELIDVLVDLVRTQTVDASNPSYEGVFPALHLLQRIRVPECKRSESRQAVLALTSCPSWHVRDKAARVYASLVECGMSIEDLQKLFDTRCHNRLHGALLCVKYYMQAVTQSALSTSHSTDVPSLCGDEIFGAGFANLSTQAFNTAVRLYQSDCSALIKSACVDIMIEIHRSAKIVPPHDRTIFRDPERLISNAFIIEDGIKTSLTTQSDDALISTLRTSLSRALALKICTDDCKPLNTARIASLIVSLGKTDPNACSHVFATALELRSAGLGDTAPANQSLLRAAATLLSGGRNIQLSCQVQRWILKVADDPAKASEETHDLLVNACTSGPTPIHTGSNQDYADQWLQLQAAALELSLGTTSYDTIAQPVHTRLLRWVSSITSAVKGDNPYTREAGTLAMLRFKSVWKLLRQSNPSLIRQLCFTIYDLLNDDEDQIRDLASQSAQHLVETSSVSESCLDLHPAEAKQKLLKVMLDQWSGEEDFVREAFLRAFDTSDFGRTKHAERIQSLLAIDATLFVEEKQNLYLDDAQEAKIWSQVLLNIHMAAVPPSIMSDFGCWAMDGLITLTTALASAKDDGLDWSATHDAFTFTLRSIYAAELLLNLAESGRLLTVRPSTIMEMLVKLLSTTVLIKASPLVLSELERVLSKCIVMRLQRQGRLLRSIGIATIQ